MKKQVAFTLRFYTDLYRRLKKAAQGKGSSVTAFVQEAVAGKLAEEDAAELFRAFTLVGEDADEVSVAFSQDAQREVVLRCPPTCRIDLFPPGAQSSL